MCTSLLDHTTPSSLGVIRVMCNDLPMFTLDSVLFTLSNQSHLNLRFNEWSMIGMVNYLLELNN